MISLYPNIWKLLPSYRRQRDIEEDASSRPSSPQNTHVPWWRRFKIFIPGLSIVGVVMFLFLGLNSIIKDGSDWRLQAIALGYIICSVLSATVFFYTVLNPSQYSAVIPVTALNVQTLQAIRSEFRRYRREQAVNLIPDRELQDLSNPSPRYFLISTTASEHNFGVSPGFTSSSPESRSEGGSEQKKANLQSHPETEGILQPSAVGESPSSTKVLAVASAIAEITKGAVEESKSQFPSVEAPTEISSNCSTPDKYEVNGAVRQRKVGPTSPQPIVTFPEGDEKE